MGEINGIVIQDLAGLSGPLEKFIKSISAGIGKIYKPTHIKRMAKARAIEVQTLSDTIADNVALPIKYENGDVTITSEDTKDLITRTTNRLLFQELLKQQNIDSVVSGAYNELEAETEVSPEPIDEDWIIRFFNSIEDVSNIELQKIWSKILAGEIKHPQSFSLRTLDILHNITKDDALLFERICKHTFFIGYTYVLFADNDYVDASNIAVEELFHLHDCGLINFQTNTTIKININPDNDVLTRNDDVLMIVHLNPQSKRESYSISLFKLTAAGTEIAKLNEISQTSNIIQFAKFMNQHYKDLTFSVHRIAYDENGRQGYYERNLLE